MIAFLEKLRGALSPSFVKAKLAKDKKGSFVSDKKGSFVSDKKGSMAVEFALILPLFLFLTFGIIEWSFYGYMRGQLESHIQEVLREVMTDNKQSYNKDIKGVATETREQFFDRMIKKAIEASTFNGVTSKIEKQNFSTIARFSSGRSTGANAGQANEFVRVTITSEYKFFTPMLGLLNNQIDQMKMQTTVYIVNEAY